jgi:hypothetical protein
MKNSKAVPTHSNIEEKQCIFPCVKHSAHTVIVICLKEKCAYGNLSCAQCLVDNAEHSSVHKDSIFLVENLFEQLEKSSGTQKYSSFLSWKKIIDNKLQGITHKLNQINSLDEKLIDNLLEKLIYQFSKSLLGLKKTFNHHLLTLFGLHDLEQYTTKYTKTLIAQLLNEINGEAFVSRTEIDSNYTKLY